VPLPHAVPRAAALVIREAANDHKPIIDVKTTFKQLKKPVSQKTERPRIKGTATEGIAGGSKVRQSYLLSPEEAAMAKVNLSGMNVEGFMHLRQQVEAALVERKTMLGKQLETLYGFDGERVTRNGRRRASGLKGRKVPAKYRSRSGETWAGRGAKPRWLVAAIRGGKKAEDFLIDKSARKGRKKHRSKR
jgi:DNA-binding protein H-NS